MELTIEQKRVIRSYADTRPNMPIDIIPGSQPPKVTGHSFYWETMGGTRINHPSAYSRTGWSNMRYVSSTISIEVGEDWVRATV